MAIDARIRELGNRHQNLESMIQDEQKRPVTDPTRMRELKRQKLQLKDEINALSARA